MGLVVMVLAVILRFTIQGQTVTTKVESRQDKIKPHFQLFNPYAGGG